MMVNKREAVSSNSPSIDAQNANENVFLGHHKPMPSVEDDSLFSRRALAEKLYYLFNRFTFPQDVWEISVPFNPFVRPNDVVFVIPDNAGKLPMFTNSYVVGGGANTAFFEPTDPSDKAGYESIAWKVIDCVDVALMDDRMVLRVTTLNKEEKKLLRSIL
jgi:hypothetical protein